MDQVWDPTGAAAAALAHVVEGFGTPVLGRPDMLEGLLNDDVPQLPREVATLTAAARYGIADRLAERVQNGVAADAAVAMVATEMTSRTAVDTAGAHWAARVFAHVIGYQVAVPPPQPMPPVAPTAPMAEAQPQTRRLDAGPVSDHQAIRPEDQATIAPGWPPVPVPQPAPVLPVLPAVANLAVAAAVATGIGVLAQLIWAWLPRSHAGETEFWVSTLALIAGGLIVATLAIRDRLAGAGLAAIAGLAVPAVSWAIFETSLATEISFVEPLRRHLALAAAVISLLAALTASCLVLVALVRQRQLARRASDPLTVGLVAVGVAFPLTNILAQGNFHGTEYGNVLGPGIHGWHVLWGLVFIILFALPPVLSWFLPARSMSQLGLWLGWLLLVLAWQISDSPIGGAKATIGLGLSWLAWAAALAGTLALAARWSAGRPASAAVPDQAAATAPWPPNRA